MCVCVCVCVCFGVCLLSFSSVNLTELFFIAMMSRMLPYKDDIHWEKVVFFNIIQHSIFLHLALQEY